MLLIPDHLKDLLIQMKEINLQVQNLKIGLIKILSVQQQGIYLIQVNNHPEVHLVRLRETKILFNLGKKQIKEKLRMLALFLVEN